MRGVKNTQRDEGVVRRIEAIISIDAAESWSIHNQHHRPCRRRPRRRRTHYLMPPGQHTPSSALQEAILTRPEIIRSAISRMTHLPLSCESLQMHVYPIRRTMKEERTHWHMLSRSRMDVVGQLNLVLIVPKRRKPVAASHGQIGLVDAVISSSTRNPG